MPSVPVAWHITHTHTTARAHNAPQQAAWSGGRWWHDLKSAASAAGSVATSACTRLLQMSALIQAGRAHRILAHSSEREADAEAAVQQVLRDCGHERGAADCRCQRLP